MKGGACMKVLMFGWEFPPKIYGGLAVASYGITKGLSLQNDVETTFCLPKPTGEEEGFLNIIGMNQVPVVWRDVNYDYLKSRLPNYMTPEQYYAFRDHIYADFSYMNVNDLGCMEFAGGIRLICMTRSTTFRSSRESLLVSNSLTLSMPTTG